MTQVRRAAATAFGVHLIAGLCMALILGRGLETSPVLRDRLAFLTGHRVWWTMGWLSWTSATFTILYFYSAFADVHLKSRRFAVLLTVAAVGPDLAAQAIEMGVLPPLAAQALNSDAARGLFLALDRVAVMLSGCVANGLYSMAALILTWAARRTYPALISTAGFAVAASGIALSAAALLDSATGMLWTNVFLVPALLLWLGGIAAFRKS